MGISSMATVLVSSIGIEPGIKHTGNG